MQTISARDLRRNHPGATTDSIIEIDGKRYKVCRYKSRDDVYELEACESVEENETVGMDIKTALQLEDEIYNDLQDRKRKAREAEARYWDNG